MKYSQSKPGSYPDKINQNSEDEYFGNGWSVIRENEKYFFDYISGSLQGNKNLIEISKEDFEAAKSGEITFDQLCIKYKVS